MYPNTHKTNLYILKTLIINPKNDILSIHSGNIHIDMISIATENDHKINFSV